MFLKIIHLILNKFDEITSNQIFDRKFFYFSSKNHLKFLPHFLINKPNLLEIYQMIIIILRS